MNTSDQNYVIELSDQDYQKAKVEVAFLLDAFASTIDNIMGGNTAPVGRIAGRDTADKLPVTLSESTLAEALGLLSQRMNAGFEFQFSGEQLFFKRCILREMCQLRSIPPGTSICRLFHAYLDGIVDGLISRPTKSTILSVGDECSIKIAVQ